MIDRTYSLHHVFARKRKILLNEKICSCLDHPLDVDTISTLVSGLKKTLPKGIQSGVIRESVVSWAGRSFTPELHRELAWRMAGNVERLQCMRPALPWNRQLTEEYVPMQIIDVRRTYRHKKPYSTVLLRILAGSPAGIVIEKTWSVKLFRAMAVRFGFSKPWGKRPFSDTREFYNLRFYGLLEPKLCGVKPGFDQFWLHPETQMLHPSSVLTYNRQILKLRSRDGEEQLCPQNYDPDRVPCYHCWMGSDQCDLAVHKVTYEQKRCPSCNKVQFFDPALRGVRVCVNCYDAQQKEIM